MSWNRVKTWMEIEFTGSIFMLTYASSRNDRKYVKSIWEEFSASVWDWYQPSITKNFGSCWFIVVILVSKANKGWRRWRAGHTSPLNWLDDHSPPFADNWTWGQQSIGRPSPLLCHGIIIMSNQYSQRMNEFIFIRILVI